MVSDAIKKYRDMLAFGLLAVAVLYLISGLSLLLKSEDDSFLSFSGRSAAIGYLFTHPALIIALATAVALVVGLGQPSGNARAVVVSALVIGGVSLVLGLVTWFAAFGYEGTGFGGVFIAGKIVAIFLGLAQLLALGLVLFFAIAAFQALPKPVRQVQQQWAGYGQQPQQQWGQPGQQQWGQQQQWAQPDQQQWGQPGQQQWGQQQQWAQPGQQWNQPEQPQAWGQHVEPQQSEWAQPDQQQAWGQHAQPAADPQPEAQAEQQGWGQPEQQQSWGQAEQQGWGQPAGHEAQSWAPSETTEADQTAGSDPAGSPDHVGEAVPDHSASGEQPGAEADSNSDEDTSEGQQDGWWQRPSQ